IRAFHVTGVQTCALPILLQIYAQAAASENGFTLGPVLLSSRDGSRRGWWEIFWQSLELEGRQFIFTTSREVTERKLAHEAAQRRSEERRVGKEGRSGWRR